MLKQITDDMLKFINNNKEKRNNDEGKKLFLYSGHDGTIVSLLSVLENFEPHYIEFSSSVIFELYTHKEENYIKVNFYFLFNFLSGYFIKNFFITFRYFIILVYQLK